MKPSETPVNLPATMTAIVAPKAGGPEALIPETRPLPALRPGDIDVVWAYGYGWPVYRGGPMFHADQLGLAAVRDTLRDLAQRLGDPSLAPAPLLERLAADGRGFADWTAAGAR